VEQRRGDQRRVQRSDAGEIRLRAQDGYQLGAVFYPARGAPAAPRVAVLHGGAGIPALRYRHFARYLAEAGISVLTYDYRGIGLSKPPQMRGFGASVEDWAEYDCAAAIGWLSARFPDAEMTGIAHSIGALLFGGAYNAGEQDRLLLVSAHTGYYGDYRPLYRLPMALLWHVVMPAVTRVVGYFPARRLGLGDDIPARVAMQWAGRHSSDVTPVAAGSEHDRTRRLLNRCTALELPAQLVSISDDAFATVASATRLLSSYYPRLQPKQHIVVTPAEAGVRRLGHFGVFSRAAGAVWPRLLALIDTKQH